MGSIRPTVANQFFSDLLYLSQHGKFNPMKLIEHYHDQNEQLKPERRELAEILWHDYQKGYSVKELNAKHHVDSIRVLHAAGYQLRPRGRKGKR